MSSGYESDYEGLDELPTFTDEDLAQLDATCAEALASAPEPADIERSGMGVDPPVVPTANPSIAIEVE
jgi:hypothetical protein